jgi:hypothetical protein
MQSHRKQDLAAATPGTEGNKERQKVLDIRLIPRCLHSLASRISALPENKGNAVD